MIWIFPSVVFISQSDAEV